MDGGNAAAAKGVLRDLHPLGDSPCRSLAVPVGKTCSKGGGAAGTDSSSRQFKTKLPKRTELPAPDPVGETRARVGNRTQPTTNE